MSKTFEVAIFPSSTSIIIITLVVLSSRRVKIMSFSHFTIIHAIERKEMTRMVYAEKRRKTVEITKEKEEKKISRRKSKVENSSTTATTNALYEPLDLLFLECSLEIENIFSLSLSLSCSLSLHHIAIQKEISPSYLWVFLSLTLAAIWLVYAGVN